MPSAKHPVFNLCRRARGSKTPAPLLKAAGLEKHPDAVREANYRLLRITTIVPRAHWDVTIFQRLAERDTWRHGGAKTIATKLEAVEQRKEEKLKEETRSECDARSHDAYNSYKIRVGERVSMAYQKRPATPKVTHTRRPTLPKKMDGPMIVLASR